MRLTAITTAIAAALTVSTAHAQFTPRELNGGAGSIWLIQNDNFFGNFTASRLFLNDAAIHGQGDAFDGVSAIVDGVPLTTGTNGFDVNDAFSDGGFGGFQSIGNGLEAGIRFDALKSAAIMRMNIAIENTGSETRFVNVQLQSNVGSDTTTTIIRTPALSNNQFEDEDAWVISDDNSAVGDPAILHAFFGGDKDSAAHDNGTNAPLRGRPGIGFTTTTAIKVAPNEQAFVLVFLELAPTAETLDASKYRSLNDLIGAGLLDDYSSFDLESISNFGPFCSSQGCSPADINPLGAPDGVIDVFDLIAFLQNFDPQNPNCSGIPGAPLAPRPADGPGQLVDPTK